MIDCLSTFLLNIERFFSGFMMFFSHHKDFAKFLALREEERMMGNNNKI